MRNSFARLVATEHRLLKRSCESLLGLCAGLMADGQLTDDEIRFLDTWLAGNEELAVTWPGEVIVTRIREVLADGEITADERDHLEKTLKDLIGGTLEETGAAGGMATRLPINEVERVDIAGAAFCFTGEFLFGTRKLCEKAVAERGGTAKGNVTTDLQYLVIGTLASRDWAHSSHGRKIEKALDLQKKGHPLLIIAEEQWVQFL